MPRVQQVLGDPGPIEPVQRRHLDDGRRAKNPQGHGAPAVRVRKGPSPLPCTVRPTDPTALPPRTHAQQLRQERMLRPSPRARPKERRMTGDDKMSDHKRRLDEYIQRVVDEAPPLSDAQRARMGALLMTSPHG